MTYEEFLETKRERILPMPVRSRVKLGDYLFPFQRDIVKWALKRGRCAVFADCGLGKTIMQLEWARMVKGPVIIFAPLAVALQTEEEAHKFGLEAKYVREPEKDIKIQITNYEMESAFDPKRFSAVVLDESSILKNYDGKTRQKMTSRWALDWRLCCTATPSPNDFLELQSHAEFLGICRGSEMQSKWFVNDGNQTQKYRLKRHAVSRFWDWVAQWSVYVGCPGDLGYSNDGYVLPELNIREHVVNTSTQMDGYLFHMPASTLSERIGARKATIDDRATYLAGIINATDEQFLVWCGLNEEANRLQKMIPDSINIQGSDSIKRKEDALIGFSHCEVSRLITKPKIAGMGMNFQNCRNMAFLGLNDSYETFYQAMRRCWRFGQKREVNVHVVTSDIEGAVISNIKRKEKAADEFRKQMGHRARRVITQEQ